MVILVSAGPSDQQPWNLIKMNLGHQAHRQLRWWTRSVSGQLQRTAWWSCCRGCRVRWPPWICGMRVRPTAVWSTWTPSWTFVWWMCCTRTDEASPPGCRTSSSLAGTYAMCTSLTMWTSWRPYTTSWLRSTESETLPVKEAAGKSSLRRKNDFCCSVFWNKLTREVWKYLWDHFPLKLKTTNNLPMLHVPRFIPSDILLELFCSWIKQKTGLKWINFLHFWCCRKKDNFNFPIKTLVCLFLVGDKMLQFLYWPLEAAVPLLQGYLTAVNSVRNLSIFWSITAYKRGHTQTKANIAFGN